MGCEPSLFIGRRVDGYPHIFPCLFIQHIILPLKSPDRIIGISQHGGNLGRIHACAVDHPLCPHIPFAGMYQISILFPPDSLHPAAEQKTHAVCTCIFRQGYGVLHGVQDAGGRDVHGKLPARIGVQLIETGLVDHFHSSYTVSFPDFLEFKNIPPVLLIKSHNQLAGPAKWDIQFLCHLVKFPVSLHCALCFQRSRRIGKSGMKHSRIPAGIAAGHIRFFFQNRNVETETGQLPGNSAAHHPCSNNDYIICSHRFLLVISSRPFLRQPIHNTIISSGLL